MSLRTKLLGVMEVLLRVPPLFLIDEILRFGLGLSQFTTNIIEFEDKLEGNGLNDSISGLEYDSKFYRFIALSAARLLLSILGCIVALCMFVLSMKHLMVVYMYLISFGVVLVSYWSNLSAMQGLTSSDTLTSTSILENILSFNFNNLMDSSSHTYDIILNYFVQCVLAFIFNHVHLGPREPVWLKLLPFSFLLPSILSMLPIPPTVLIRTPVFAALMPILLVKYTLWSSVVTVIYKIYDGYMHARTFINNFGMSALIEAEWMRLSVPEVLRTFWLLRLTENLGLFFFNGNWIVQDGLTPLFRLVKDVMVSGCDTLTGVLGVTSVVSFVCHQIGVFFQWLMLTEDENDKSIGTVSAILFYILALQTGLTGLEPEKRFVRLCRNFCLLFTALLHFIHNIVNPLLMSLSASHNPSLKKHLRALLVCAFLILFPILLLVYLWSNHNISTWLLAVSAFSIEVIVKVFVSLAIYGLFLLDAKRDIFWERLDDYVYYIRAFGNTVEFCFGIFLFFNGAWILVFESGGAIRAIMMCIHAYFNIWCDARAGWSVFMKRRTAVHKIESLPEASEEQLQRLDDVCAICYQEMKAAKITRCKHFFHGVCLRKWLYVQDRCPLCHEILHSVEFDDLKENVAEHEAQPINNDEVNNYNR